MATARTVTGGTVQYGTAIYGKDGQKVLVFLGDRDETTNPHMGLAADETASMRAVTVKDGVYSATFTGATYFSRPESSVFTGLYSFSIPVSETSCETLGIYFSSVLGESNDRVVCPKMMILSMLPDWSGQYQGTGLDYTTDTMSKIRDYIDSTIVPKLRSEAGITEFSGSGWISRISDAARLWVNEPIGSAKYTNARILQLIESGIRVLFTDNLLIGAKPIYVRYNITVENGEQNYVLPPNVASVHRVAIIDSTTGRPYEELYPTSENSPYVGWRVEGNMLRITGKDYLNAGDTYEVLYIPNGDIKPHKATKAEAINSGATTFTLSSTATDGSVDTRPNAYAGYIFRVFADATNPEEIVTVASSTASVTPVLTFGHPFACVHTSPVTYELVPSFDPLFEDLLVLRVALDIAIAANDALKVKTLTEAYATRARAFRMQLCRSQSRVASYMHGDDPDNENYYVVGGMY